MSPNLDHRPRAGRSNRYDATTIVLHWTIAVGVVVQWLGAHVIDRFPRGPLRVDARSIHICLGAVMTALFIFRLYWRTHRGRSFEGDQKTAVDQVARVMQWALNILLLGVLLLGVFNTWLRGDSIMGWFHIPKFGDYDAAARHQFANQVVGFHRNAANLLLLLAAAHATAAIIHHAVLKDDVMRRMAPRRALR
jgi:cytochrome b561